MRKREGEGREEREERGRAGGKVKRRDGEEKTECV